MGMIQLGFPTRIIGRPGLRTCDARQIAPHLSVSLVYLRDILSYLGRIGVRFYRIATALLPSGTPDYAARQIATCSRELAATAALVQQQGVRLTLHLDLHCALGNADDGLAARSLAQIEVQAALLDQLGTRCDGVLVSHIGGATSSRSERLASLRRFERRYQALSQQARERLVVEHDTNGFSLGAALELHQRCGVPVVFDYLHWQLANPERLPLDLALGLALATWADGVRPEVHLSTARSEAHLLPGRGKEHARVLPPRPGQHADFVASSDTIHLLSAASGLPPFDLMLEAKAGDLALLRLRHDLARLAPDLAARVC